MRVRIPPALLALKNSSAPHCKYERKEKSAKSTCLRRAFMLYFNLPGCRSHPGHRLAGAANRARLFYWGQKILKETNQKCITTFLNWQIAQFRACR